jgi:mannose-6-phosphate isomerase
MKPLYPLKFKTIFKDKLWGGQKIKEILGKDYGDLPNCGETWELSGVEGNISVVENGSLAGKDLVSLIEEYKENLVGHSVFQKFGYEFPLLIKFIDANQDLSIQVHPDDQLAKERHGGFGKTEMWYVMQADENSKLISGFNRQLDKDTYLDYFKNGKILDILNTEFVAKDDVFFLPAGRVHTIGKGLLIAEIQQTSDITYRIYDFDRKDAEGNKRELHVEESLDAIDFTYHEEYKTQYVDELNKQVDLVNCDYFTTNKYALNQPMKLLNSNHSFTIYIGLEGSSEIEFEGSSYAFRKGDVYLIPAEIEEIEIIPNSSVKFLETFIPIDAK